MKLSELAKLINASVVGDGDADITGVNTLDDAGPGDVSFLANPRYTDRLRTTKAGAICVTPDVKLPGRSLLVSTDPYHSFTLAMVELVGQRKHPHQGVHPRAFVDPAASVGEGSILYPNVYVGPRAKVGRDCILYPGVVVYDDCVIGDRVIIHANTVIGQDGFGFATHAGVHHKTPMAGIVVIEDDVEIGSNCTVERATMGQTLIERGTKMSDIIAIGHGCKIGKHCLIVSQTGIAGSTTLGDHVVLAGQVGLAGHLKIGNMVKIGAQSGVMEDIPDKSVVLGSPAQPIGDARRTYIAMMQLPEILKRLKAIERSLPETEAQS